MEKKERILDCAKVAISATCIIEACFLLVNILMDFVGKYGSVTFEVMFHLVFMLIAFLTAFLSLWTYKTGNGPKRFLHLMLMSLPVTMLTGLLLIAPLQKGITDTLKAMFQPFWFMLWACSAMIPCLIGTIIIQKWRPKLLKWSLILLVVMTILAVMRVSPTLGR